MKNQFDDLGTAVKKVGGPFDPVFRFVIQAEPPFPLAVMDQVGPVGQNHHVVIVNPEKVGCIGDYLEPARHHIRTTIPGNQLAQPVPGVFNPDVCLLVI
jgi:hypothetical protein